MTIASEITRINNNIASAYTACNNKGATMPATQNSANLATTIGTISTGPQTLYGASLYTFLADVDANGNLYASNTPTYLSFDGVIRLQNDALRYSFLQNDNIKTVDFPDLSSIPGSYALSNTFNSCTSLTSVTFPDLYGITGTYALYVAFNQCTNLSTLTFPALTGVGGGSACRNMAVGCTSLTSISYPSLIKVNGSLAFYTAFQGCTSLSSVSFPELVQIGSDTATGNNLQHFALAFDGCTSLTELRFPKLEKIYINGGNVGNNGTFANNTTIQKMYFPKLDTIDYSPAYTGTSSSVISARKWIFYNCSSLTELHFAAANETAIKATAGWSTLWGRGAGNATVYFDL
jgi:hypothetical protein